jgi:nicotinamidase/pyrazinamidase
MVAAGAELSKLSDQDRDFRPGDVLVVVDMQKDFVPHVPGHSKAGTAGGQEIVPLVCKMIAAAAAAGSKVVATRDYHPKSHCSFVENGGHFPSHCVQGSGGSQFEAHIAAALNEARTQYPGSVEIVFKGFVPQTDSFGSATYSSEFFEEQGIGGKGIGPKTEICGCCAVDWTGSFGLEASNLEEDINAPPDVMSVFERRPLLSQVGQNEDGQPVLKGAKRLFSVGLCKDLCVMDTALNAAALVRAGPAARIPPYKRSPWCFTHALLVCCVLSGSRGILGERCRARVLFAGNRKFWQRVHC